jgi:hypothetical protein
MGTSNKISVKTLQKHAMHIIHRLAWTPMLVDPGQLPSVPMR